MKTSSIIGAVFGAVFRVGVAIFAIYAIYNGALMAYDYGYRIFTEPAVSSGEGRAITVTVTEDMSPSDIGELLFAMITVIVSLRSRQFPPGREGR